MNPVIIEKIHRYVFDTIYVQKHKTTIVDLIVLFVYNKIDMRYPNWRYDLHTYAKSVKRYDSYNRIDY